MHLNCLVHYSFALVTMVIFQLVGTTSHTIRFLHFRKLMTYSVLFYSIQCKFLRWQHNNRKWHMKEIWFKRGGCTTNHRPDSMKRLKGEWEMGRWQTANVTQGQELVQLEYGLLKETAHQQIYFNNTSRRSQLSD